VLNVSDRKVLRKIYGPVLANGQWRNRYNHEIYKIYKENELTRNIRLRRFQWVGHVMGMPDETVTWKALKDYVEGRRQVGRPRKRWLDGVDRDTERMLKYRTGEEWQRIQMPGGGRLKRPRLKLDCSAIEEDDEEEEIRKRIWEKEIGHLCKHNLILTTSCLGISKFFHLSER
jgi:hypothetical protein